jgi:hypothetical protein
MAGASADTLHHAYVQRTEQLAPDVLSGAPSPVVSAATRARDAVEAAWLVLGDRDRRLRYDKEIGLYRNRGRGRGFQEGPQQYGQDPYDLLRSAEGLIGHDAWGSFEALMSWMAPLPAPQRRRLVVPDVRGLFHQPCRSVLTMAGLRLMVTRLTPDPMPVEGLVVDQSPGAGSQVRSLSSLTVHLWHPPRRR